MYAFRHAQQNRWRSSFPGAAHQVLEAGRIFSDPLAVRILGESEESIAAEAAQRSNGKMMRIFIAARTRVAEDALAAAVARGARQLVVLGAGLATYAYRGAVRERLRIFEMDHPATQEWKRQRLADAGIPLPPGLIFAPVDFERQTLAEGLRNAGFDPGLQTYFAWLGVVPYLTEDAVWSTLRFIATGLEPREVVFDYADPPESLSPEAREFHDRRAARVAELGEAWLTYFEPASLHARLNELGFRQIEDLGPREIAARSFPHRAAEAPERGGHILRASTE